MNIDNQFVRLDDLSIDHAQSLSEWVLDEETCTWWLHEPPTTLEKIESAITRALALRDTQERQPFAIYSKPLGKYVGETSFWFEGAGIEIGSTWMCREVRGTEFNQQVKQLMLDTAFNKMGYDMVTLQTDSRNLRSQRAIEKIGGIRQEIRPNDKITWSGHSRDSIIYHVHKNRARQMFD